MNTEIKEEYDGMVFTVEFTIGHPQRRGSMGKHWPKTTQCVIKRDGLIIGTGEAVKHEKEKDNQKYARFYSAKKAFQKADNYTWSELRGRLWGQILRLPA